MKHNLLISANGLCTPPCGSSHGKSLSFQFRNSLLLLFLLIVGTGSAWARPTIYGEGLPGLNASGASNWDSNTKEMSAYGEANTYYAEFLNVEASSNNKYRFKIAVNGSGNWWEGAMDSNNVNEGMGNVDIVAGNETQISFKMPFNGDVYIFYKSTNSNESKVWIVAVPQNVAAAPNNSGDRRLKTDIMLSGSGWTSEGIKFAKNNDVTTYKHVTSYILPTKKNTETGAIRFEMYYNNEAYISGKDASVRAALSTSTPQRIIYLWDGNQNGSWIAYTLPAYPVRKSGWKLFIDGYNSGNATNLDANGEATVTLSGGSTYQFFIANTDQATTVSSYSSDIKSYPAVHGVNCFGGCYIDEGNSSNVSFQSQQVYDASKYGTLVKSVVAAQDLRGVFQVSGSGTKDVTFNFDGGVITINAVDHAEPGPTDRTYDGTEYMFFNKNQTCTEGDHPSLDFSKDDARLYVHFKNASTSVENTPERAFFWDSDKTILAVKVPAGTYKKFQIYRISKETDGWYEWNHSYELPLDYTTKNYLSATSTTAATWDTYAPPTFRFVLSGTASMTGDNSDFEHWNGNGTVYTGSTTKDLNSGTYKFKINPAGVTTANNMWVNEFNWNDIDLPNSSNNINLRDGNNKEIWFDLANRSQVTIACDGSKVTVVATPVQKYTVTFNTDGGSTIDPVQVSDGSPVAQPADPTKAGYIFSKWQLESSDYDFNNSVTRNITLDAVWAYKPIESVSLNESTHMTWVGNSDFALTPTLAPSDLIAKSVAWISNKTSVATVSDGTVHAVGEGIATITCTVTDQFDTQRSASCEVTVAACQMIVDNLYSMTVTGYNTSTGSSATLSGLWNESSDNDGPASLTMYYLTITPLSGGKRYLYADESDHYVKRNTSNSSADNYYWIKEKVGKTGNNLDIYTIKNYGTGLYLASDDATPISQNWYAHRAIVQADGTSNVAKWHYIDGCGAKLMNVAFSNGDNSYTTHETFLHVDLELGYGTINYHMNDESIVAVGSSDGCQNRQAHRPVFEGERVIDNPNYKASLMNTSYYRMKENATVQANLNASLVSGAVITVRLYADAATSVKLQKTDGTEIEIIDLSADADREYSYTVASNSALVGESAFVIKATDNHAGIASIEVSRTHAASPLAPALAWETDLSGGVTQSVLSGTFQHTASSTLSSGAIHYISSNPTVATVAANGTVTPLSAGNTTITATIEEEGCYGEASITYNVTLTEASLQEAIDATAASGTLTLTCDYATDNAVINKAITINGQGHTIGDLTVQTAGDLTLSSGLKVRDFTICAKAGNTTNPAASGQVRNAANLTCTGNAYFLYTVDPSGHVQYCWYDFTVPFPVNVMTGIKGIQDDVMKETFANEVDYAIMEYLGERKAQGQYPYQKFRGVMQPNQLYSITLDSRDNYNTVRFQKTADGDLVANDNVTLHPYAGSGAYTNLNGVGNGTLHHADADNLSSDHVQVYQSGDKTFLTVAKTQYSFVVGTAFMVQEAGTMTLSQANDNKPLLAPSRYESAPATAIQIAREGQPFLSQGNDYFSDQLFISASETGGQAYTPGTDLAKAGNIGNVNVPQIWTNAYNTKLCVHEAQLINGEASYNLSIYAPAADTYTLTSLNIPADYSLYITQNGMIVSELSDTYTLDLSKGITTEYGLLLVETYKTPTGIENTQTDKIQTTKIIRNGVLYILHNGKIYDAQGGKMK